jgi:hypothetical protein
VVVSGQHSKSTPFSGQTKTVMMSAHGALILLREKVGVGQKLRVKNLGTTEEMTCTVTDVNPGSTDIPEIGVGFAQPCARFWRVSLPPANWSPHNSEAKRFAVTPDPPKTVLFSK